MDRTSELSVTSYSSVSPSPVFTSSSASNQLSVPSAGLTLSCTKLNEEEIDKLCFIKKIWPKLERSMKYAHDPLLLFWGMYMDQLSHNKSFKEKTDIDDSLIKLYHENLNKHHYTKSHTLFLAISYQKILEIMTHIENNSTKRQNHHVRLSLEKDRYRTKINTHIHVRDD